tara:strand:+ start:5551 stop:6159 length:609 start_codon:yes stop_codon:yes gene_type:complete
MPINVSEFAANLPGGGARPNLFEVVFADAPGDLGAGNKLQEGGGIAAGAFLVKATSIPGTTITKVDVPFRGRNIRVPGVREFDDTWVTTVINDTDFRFRRWCEDWMDKIASHESNVGQFDLTKIKADMSVYQLDHKDGSRIRGYKFVDCWPSEIAAIELDAGTNDSIEEFDITWTYNYWMVDEAGETRDAESGPGSKTNTVT